MSTSSLFDPAASFLKFDLVTQLNVEVAVYCSPIKTPDKFMIDLKIFLTKSDDSQNEQVQPTPFSVFWA